MHRKTGHYEERHSFIAELSKKSFEWIMNRTPKQKAELEKFFDNLFHYKYPDLAKPHILKSKNFTK